MTTWDAAGGSPSSLEDLFQNPDLRWMMNGDLSIINRYSMGYLWYFMGK